MRLLHKKKKKDTDSTEQGHETTSTSVQSDYQPTTIPLPPDVAYIFIPYLPPQPLLPLSPTPELQETLHIHHPSSWSYTGPLLPASPSSLPPSFHTWSQHTFSSPSLFLSHLLPLLSFLWTFLPEQGLQNYWLTIRATTPTVAYDIPRWHVDEDIFAPGFSTTRAVAGYTTTSRMQDKGSEKNARSSRTEEQGSWKMAATLLGPTTLFLSRNDVALATLHSTTATVRRTTPSHSCTSTRCLGCSTTHTHLRYRLASSLSQLPVDTPRIGEIAVLKTGWEDGAVHSEPPCGVERVFVNIVPGGEEGLRRVAGRWGMGWPRAWVLNTGRHGGRKGGVVSDEFGWVVEGGEGTRG